MKSIRELRVTQSYFFFQMLQFVRLQLLFTSEQMRSINRITAASQRGTVGRNNMHSLTSDCGLTREALCILSTSLQTHHLHIKQQRRSHKQTAECRQGPWSTTKEDYLLHRPQDCFIGSSSAARKSSGAIWSPNIC